MKLILKQNKIEHKKNLIINIMVEIFLLKFYIQHKIIRKIVKSSKKKPICSIHKTNIGIKINK